MNMALPSLRRALRVADGTYRLGAAQCDGPPVG
jgi:hypothetical protein